MVEEDKRNADIMSSGRAGTRPSQATCLPIRERSVPRPSNGHDKSRPDLETLLEVEKKNHSNTSSKSRSDSTSMKSHERLMPELHLGYSNNSICSTVASLDHVASNNSQVCQVTEVDSYSRSGNLLRSLCSGQQDNFNVTLHELLCCCGHILISLLTQDTTAVLSALGSSDLEPEDWLSLPEAFSMLSSLSASVVPRSTLGA